MLTAIWGVILSAVFNRPFASASSGLRHIARYNTITNTWTALGNNGLNDFARGFVFLVIN